MKELKGRVAFVTGGASGIGLGIVKAFVGAGMRVAVADVRRESLDKAVQEIGLQTFGKKIGSDYGIGHLGLDSLGGAGQQDTTYFQPCSPSAEILHCPNTAVYVRSEERK